MDNNEFLHIINCIILEIENLKNIIKELEEKLNERGQKI